MIPKCGFFPMVYNHVHVLDILCTVGVKHYIPIGESNSRKNIFSTFIKHIVASI